MRKFGIGLDIGIGSVGFAVLSWSNDEDARIEHVGARLFESGELGKPTGGKNRKSQERRGFRSVRRLVRRRAHRKERVKRFLQKIGLITKEKIKVWQELNGNQNIFQIRLKGLEEKLSPEELADCIIHICNHRGYRDFYEEDGAEGEKIKGALEKFDELYLGGNYKSVAHMVLTDPVFKTATNFPDYKNHKDSERYVLIKREPLKQELLGILNKQQEFYPKALNKANIDFLVNSIVFAQRDFEDGPGDKNDKNRKFMGFLDTLGQCMFYKTEKRAFRSTVIADVYSVINHLSQFAFVDTETGEIVFKAEAAKAIINIILKEGKLTKTDLKKELKKYNLEIIENGGNKLDPGKMIKTLPVLKKVLVDCGESFEKLLEEEQLDINRPSRLHKLCLILSENITPKRRKKALAKAGWSDKVQNAMVRQKFGGTTSVCEQYMLEAIEAFCNGETYGNFQSRRLVERDSQQQDVVRHKLLPPITMNVDNGGDEDLVKNVVVFKAINETRKVINAIIRRFGSPEYINIEVADELGRSLEERKEIADLNKNNNKDYENISKKLVELQLVKDGEVRPNHVERYRLWKQQCGIDIYTGKVIPEDQILSNMYDVDHIVPYSLILDNTLSNKALVDLGANRALKGQRVPLEYLTGAARELYRKNINELFKKKLITKKKYQYLMLTSLQSAEAKEILEEWKSRNINDTRYITKYIANYLANNLKFTGNGKKHVFAIKGAITSRMRKIWLNEKSWGSPEKDRDNHLHHAADAIVIANLTPAYVEIVSDNMKLTNIFKRNHKKINDEYRTYLENAVKKMQKYYGFSDEYTRSLLEKHGTVPARLRRINEETDIRLADPNLEFYSTTINCEEAFRERVKDFYRNDQEFAESIPMALVSYKITKKYQGQATDSNPVKKSERKDTSVVKLDTLGNENILSGNKYYCVEIYKTNTGKTMIRGIRIADVVKKDKKIWLKCQNPADYGQHVMYLFGGEYISVFSDNNVHKMDGYYASAKNLNEKKILVFNKNDKIKNVITIGFKFAVKKYMVDIIGYKGGEVKCSAPFMLLPQKQ